MDQARQFGCVSALVVAVLTGTAAAAQTVPGPLPAFDVVSIRPHQDEGVSRMGIWFNTTPDGLFFKGGSLDMLLHFAFDVPRDRLLNEPEWVTSSRFDVEAKVAPEDAPRLETLTRQQHWAMLIPALEDRCRLKFHHESRKQQVYTLVVARGSAKLSEASPANSDATKPGTQSTAEAPQTPLMMGASPKGMTVKGHDATIESLIQMLSQQVGITVVDNTGLTGKYDFTLSWMPDEDSWHLMGLPIPGPPPGRDGQPHEAMGPSIFAALEEQLGLKAEARKAPVDVIVIDHIEPPSAN
jgi:uncharacterized protein (TIGR03435 family)